MLDIYKASAGSGKTFALTLEYFKIVFEVPTEYKNILAVTFTNKATEEMKSRIINELHKLAEGEGSDYAPLLKDALYFDDDQLRNRASLLRTLLLHDYGRLSVTTIDRFFQRLVKGFTRELGIFPGYNVELDSDFVLAKAVDKVMQGIRENTELKNWVKALMESSVEEGKSWGVKSKMADLGAELFRENYMLFDKHVLDKFGDRHFLHGYRTFLKETASRFESALTAFAADALQAIQEAGLELPDFKSGKSGCASWFYKLAAGNFDPPTPTVRKGAGDTAAWAAQKSPRRADIDNIAPRLMEILQQALAFYDTQYSKYLSAVQLSGNLYQLGILNDLYREVRAYCTEKGLMLLSDTTHILNLLIAGNDTSFLFEKCGNYYKHLMIDEFQDTSSMQWRNFRPLVVNSLAEGGRAMIVGDVKQSIYRWRNGEWSLLAHGVEEQFRHLGGRNVHLTDNWRSARDIVEFNNTFFEAAARSLAALYAAEAGEDGKGTGVIEEAYAGLRQTPRKPKRGYVDITFGPVQEEKGAAEAIMADMVAAIDDIRARGGRLKEAVILVRGGNEGAFVADYLIGHNKTAGNPINFISNDSLYVASSPYVQFIVAVLRYLFDPADEVNRATILYFHRTFVEDLENFPLHSLFVSAAGEDIFLLLPTDFTPDTSSVLSYSLYETVETIIRQFSLTAKEEEIPYLIAFQDILYEYEAGNSNSIPLFLEWWEQEREKRVLTTSEEVDAIRILTIHKSKGLEFEYVLLPFCSWELDKVHPVRRIWCGNHVEGFDALEYAPLNYSARLAGTIFRDDYLDEHLKAYIDNLNLLYVALTRAKGELYVRPFAPKVKRDGTLSLSDIGAFIYRVLEECAFPLEEGRSFRTGERVVKTAAPLPAAPACSLTAYPVWEPGDRISVKYRYRDYADPGTAALSAIDEGKLLHELFKSIRHAADVPEAVRRACLSGLIHRSEQETLAAKIAACIAQPGAAPWFATDAEVITERDILFPGGAKARPDRVVEKKGTLYVIDYKFGHSEEARYIKQVRRYCDTLRKMGYPRVEGYVWYVKSGNIIPC